MDRVAACRHGSGFAGHRPSVTWTIGSPKNSNSSIRAPSLGNGSTKNGSVNTGTGNEDPDPKKKPDKKKAGSDLQEIGLLYGGSLFLNAIIGPGIFGTPKGVLAGVGSVGMCMVMWTFTSIFSMCAALCFAELRESVRREGVEYAYITEAFGPLAGFVYSWMRIAAAEPVSTAVFALAFSDYVADAIYDDCGPPRTLVIVIATFAVVSMALVNVLSTKLSERLQMLALVGKTTALSVMIIMGIKRMIDGHVEVIDEGMKGTTWSASGLAMSCYNGLWAYGGWSNVNHVTSGIKKPPRNVPRVAKTVLPIVLIIYIFVMLSYFTAMTRAELLASRAIGVTWAERVLGPASSIIYIGVCLTALGSLNATFLSAGRLSGVAAKNGQMPDVASWVHVRSKTPLITVALRVCVATLAICLATGQELLRFYIFCVWMFHGGSILALLLLRYKNKDKKRPYKVDLWIPVLVVTVIIYLLLAPFLQKPEPEFIAALVLILLSLIFYYPLNWLKERSVISVPDKVAIYLQLLLRIAPKRDLRRERKSMMRRMSMLARESIFITPTMPSPAMMRRMSRRLSKMTHMEGSPALIKRMGEQPTLLRRRINRGGSLAEADMKPIRERSGSLWTLGSHGMPSPALIRKKPRRSSHSFNHADRKSLPSVPSLPILKNRHNTTPVAPADSEPGALAPLATLQIPSHMPLKPCHSPIPEESIPPTPSQNSPSAPPPSYNNVTGPNFASAMTAAHIDRQQESEDEPEDLQVVADFESDGGGEYEVLAHTNDMRQIAFDNRLLMSDNNIDYSSDSDSSSSSTCSSSSDSKRINSGRRKSIFADLFHKSSASSSSESSMEEDGSDNYDFRVPIPSYYYSDNEIGSESDDEYESGPNTNDHRNQTGFINKGFVVEGAESVDEAKADENPENEEHQRVYQNTNAETGENQIGDQSSQILPVLSPAHTDA